MKPGELSTYEGLVDSRWKGRICIRSSKHVYNVALLASLVAHHGEKKAEEWARGLKANLARKPQGNDRAQVKAIHAGECDISLGNSYYMGKMLTNEKQIAWAEAVNVFFPNQEGRGAHMNISGAGVTRHAPRKDNAVKLLEFLSDDLAQKMYAEQNFEYPVKPGVPWSGLVESWGKFKADEIDMVKVAENPDDRPSRSSTESASRRGPAQLCPWATAPIVPATARGARWPRRSSFKRPRIRLCSHTPEPLVRRGAVDGGGET